jgi:hypothetical protein
MKRIAFQRMQRVGLIALVAILGWLLPGCSKPKPPAPEETATTNRPTVPSPAAVPGANTPGARLSDPTNQPSPATTNPATAEASAPGLAARMAALKQEYRTAKTFDDRFEVAVRIGESGTAEAVTSLEELFRDEPDKELRVELINALIGLSGAKEERLRFLQRALAPSQPAEVREAAMDGLVDLEDARALPLLQGMCNDPEPKLQDLARQLHALAEKMVKAL